MSMHGLLKGHFGIMKMTAIEDYNRVKIHCIDHNVSVIEPKKLTTKHIENATAEMIHPMINFPYYLNRGFNYYKSLKK